MRFIRDDEAKAIIGRIQNRCREFNPNTENALCPFLYRFLTALESVLSQTQWSEVANQLTSERVMRKRKLERLKGLIAKADESDIEKFEQKLERKNKVSNSDLSEKTAEIS